ncbi:MAG: ChaN family lipoprotein [Rubrivivax sp.]
MADAAQPLDLTVRLLVFGEQHDQFDQQRQVADQVRALAERQRLAAVVLEMADAPHSTRGLPHDAEPAQVRDALHWRNWPWEAYAAVVMNAVRAGVPVWGGNLPRADMRAAMADAQLDALVDAATFERLAEAVRNGHCNLLPASQLPGMVRIQLARDRSMARVAAAAVEAAGSNQTVLLLAGAQHAARDRGVPLHLLADKRWSADAIHVVLFGRAPDELPADEWREALLTPQPDYCDQLRQRAAAPGAASGNAGR